MPLNRSERLLIESFVKDINLLKNALRDAQATIKVLSNTGNDSGFGSLSTSEITELIAESVKNIISKTQVKKHNHTSDEKGGDAFAKLGASLID